MALAFALPASAQVTSVSNAGPQSPLTAGRMVVTGTWTGAIELDGIARRVALALHERRRGEIFGYVLGGNSAWTIVAGARDGNEVQLTLEVALASHTRVVTIHATTTGTMLRGASDDGSGARSLALRRRTDVLHERRLVFAELVGGGPASSVRLAVVLDGVGRLVAGGFEGPEECELFACLGAVTAFSETGTALSINLAFGGPCPGTGSIAGSFDSMAGVYTGSWTRTDCGGPTGGSLLGARSTRTRTDDVHEILGRLAATADRFEAGLPFGGSHGILSPSYLHFGRTAADVAALFDAEIARYTDIHASFERIHQIATVDEPFIFPNFDPGTVVLFDETRSGVPIGGGPRETYIDSHARAELPLLHRWTNAGGWHVDGNQAPGYDLPFDYTIGPRALEISTPGGALHASFGSFGAHFLPMTGHVTGDGKTNGAGFLTADDSDLTELAGNFNGILEPGETWGFWGGLSGEHVRSRTPVYTSPWDGAVTAVVYDRHPSGFYFDDPPFWLVFVEHAEGLVIRIGHAGSIANSLRLRILAATGIDTSTYSGSPGDELLDGLQLPVAAGAELCHPQIVANPVPGFPGYFTGGGGFRDRPWVQLEWFLEAPVGFDFDDVCHFDLMAPATKAAIQSLIDAEVLDPLSQRYRDFYDQKWLWGTEGCACMTYSAGPQDFSGLDANLGGWYEVDGPTTTSDEVVAFARVATEAAAYDPVLLDPANAGWMLARQRESGLQYTWAMPDGTTVIPFRARAEVLDLQESEFLVKWREIGYAPGGVETPVFQRAAYVLDGGGLKVKWGEFAVSAAGAVLPTLSPTDPCNDDDVICYDHTFQSGY